MSPPRPAIRMTTADSVNKTSAIPESAMPLLERLTRLRVCTASQAHLLTPAFTKGSLRNAYHRLATLVRQGWLVMDAVSPGRGAVSPQYYRLSHQTLRAMKHEKLGLLQRPAQHVLEYLLFRAEVYARARAEGWYIGSPLFLPTSAHAAALQNFTGFLKARALDRYKAAQAKRASPQQLAELKTALERLPLFLPSSLSFEFIYRSDAKNGVSQVVLLLVDDVRRSVSSQAKALPLSAAADCPVLIRDCDSVWNSDASALHFTGNRLVELQREAASHFGTELQLADQVLPTVWPRTVRPQQSTRTTKESHS